MHNSVFPDTYQEFSAMFPDESACVGFLKKIKWPNGFVCPKCSKLSEPWQTSRGRLTCPNCRCQTTVSSNTIFDKTRTPIKIWFEAAWHLTTAKNGMSAKTLERTLGVSYKTAWMMLHRFRVAMVDSERTLLTGDVEVDESLVGGEESGGKRGRGSDKAIVVIAIEIKQPKGFGRVRMKSIPNASGKSLIPFIQDAVAPGSNVMTDGWSGYNELSNLPYKWTKKVLSSSDDLAHITMPGVHRIASLLKRWILGTHQGSVGDEHLQSYLEEFTFRFNRRNAKSRGLVFYRLLQFAISTNPVTENDIIHGFDW